MYLGTHRHALNKPNDGQFVWNIRAGNVQPPPDFRAETNWYNLAVAGSPRFVITRPSILLNFQAETVAGGVPETAAFLALPQGTYRIGITGTITQTTGDRATPIRWDDMTQEFGSRPLAHTTLIGASTNIFSVQVTALPANSNSIDTTVNFQKEMVITNGNTRFGIDYSNSVYDLSGNLTVSIARLK